MTTIRTYQPKKVLMALGSHSVRGYADDSFIVISKNGDGILKKTGCDGEIARATSPDNSYNVKITLLQTSSTNAFLQRKYDLDNDNGNGTFPLLIKDLTGGVLFSADVAWVTKPTDRTYAKDTANREWIIDTGDANYAER